MAAPGHRTQGEGGLQVQGLKSFTGLGFRVQGLRVWGQTGFQFKF